MLKTIFIFLLILFANSVFGQETQKQEDELLFNEAFYYSDVVDFGDTIKYSKEFILENFNKSLFYYQKLIDKYPDSEFIYLALENKYFIENEIHFKENAKKSLIAILKCEKLVEECKGGNITNHKNDALKSLVNLYIEENNFLEAIKYLDLSDKFPYRSSCGNGHEENRLEMNLLYSKCYIGLNDFTKAYKLLLPNIMFNPLSNNSELINYTYFALLKKYSKSVLKNKYEQAFKSVKIEKSSITDRDIHYIIFLDVKIKINDPIKFDLETQYKNSKLYKLLNNK